MKTRCLSLDCPHANPREFLLAQSVFHQNLKISSHSSGFLSCSVTALKFLSMRRPRMFSLAVYVDYFHCLAFIGSSVSVGTRYVDVVITLPECVSLRVFDEHMCVHSVDLSSVGFLQWAWLWVDLIACDLIELVFLDKNFVESHKNNSIPCMESLYSRVHNACPPTVHYRDNSPQNEHSLIVYRFQTCNLCNTTD